MKLCSQQASLLLLPSFTQGFLTTTTASYSSFRPLPAQRKPQLVDANTYNINVEEAAQLWTVSVSAENQLDRAAAIPYLTTNDSRAYGVDDVQVTVQRSATAAGLGLDLLELAGGRDDGYGITIVQSVSGNAEKAGVLPGDSVAAIAVAVTEQASTTDTSVQETIVDTECRDFDTTLETLSTLLSNHDPVADVTLSLKRIRRWPKITVAVEYPPSQCANPDDRVEVVTLTAGENLRRGLLNRRIVMEDPLAPTKCDFCGGRCTVRVERGMHLLSPMSVTEQKLLRQNPGCRVSCRTVVGYGRQEGEMRLKINLYEWTRDAKEKK